MWQPNLDPYSRGGNVCNRRRRWIATGWQVVSHSPPLPCAKQQLLTPGTGRYERFVFPDSANILSMVIDSTMGSTGTTMEPNKDSADRLITGSFSGIDVWDCEKRVHSKKIAPLHEVRHVAVAGNGVLLATADGQHNSSINRFLLFLLFSSYTEFFHCN